MSAIDLQLELSKIIDKEKIKAVFQPICNISTHKVHGFEALSRGPEHSPLFSPVPLFKTAAYEGRLSELETLCRRISIQQFKNIQLPGKLFINISPKALLEPNHAKGLTLSLVQELGLHPSQVVIELSEQYPADDIDLLKSCLNHYRSQGFLTAIDDLGAGYSGLRLWSELAPDYVKIDRHFIESIDSSSVKQEFVRSIINLCQNLSCKVIAEGIETQAELAVLKQLGIVYCQGFLLGRPTDYPNRCIPFEPTLEPTTLKVRFAESAESLCCRATTCQFTSKLKQIGETFNQQANLQAIVVMQDELVIGLVLRSQVIELFSTPYGRALHENRAVDEVLTTELIRIEANMPISQVSQRLTKESTDLVVQQFIILKQGKLLGIGHTKDLLAKITDQKIAMARHANPLTGLPGNIPIQEELLRLRQQKKPFYLAYFDLSHFKPYNDIYGFCRGDEVIMEVSRLLLCQQTSSNFIGHVGGDDFVIISTCEDIEHQAMTIIDDFETAKSSFYSKQHWQDQQMLAEDRNGRQCYHDLISLSVGILPPSITIQCNEHQLSLYSAQAKKQAKQAKNSLSIFSLEANISA
ncbi:MULTISPECIES: bifunctional diguanylate cyclase/phosphodiesterase [unclassified Shewanella]|uniref:GGDEF domain-containing protein n=1 Tax=unclassified Shewanella TaxID=196818 RepID=UPI001BC3EB80|nr:MULTISPECIES: bifunctional diguanylate cyclase/phosphodiesterase [unclassified Shewanella]GIU13703.1 D-glycero-D-manno-heptose 1-phosphate guanosyltransferase [Shewanella sp. MBTL60-112-B1]GIU28203.1 D-glycero-D-manno-heptose 1-phosphate guanosyltransferase [Shewanella sp. MBTL60-112-B2]